MSGSSESRRIAARWIGIVLLATSSGTALGAAGCRPEDAPPEQRFPEVSPGEVGDTLGFDTIPGTIITPDETAPGRAGGSRVREPPR